MAGQQNGYRIVPHGSYDDFRSYALSNGVNVDYSWGNQCWDICALLWYQYGFRLQTGNGYAYGCWTVRRYQNAVGPFTLVTRKEDIRRGDVLVFNKYGSYYTGHIGFADENYHGNNINLLGQNQGQGTGYGKASIVKKWRLTYFLGGFRNNKWSSTPPGPTPPPPGPTPGPSSISKQGFPWFIYNKKFKNNSR